ncbi:MAG: glycosyltransferase family 4 protein [Candidatus Woesearchaeota archaeon]
MNKPKVLHIITRFIRAGADENTLITAIGNTKKYDVTLAFGTAYNNEFVEKAKKCGIKIKVFKTLKHNNFFLYLPALVEIFLYIKKEKFDIVHTHTSEAGFLGRIAAKMSGVPIIIHTIHGPSFTEQRNFLINNCAILLERICAKFTHKIISNADTLTDDYLSKKIGRKEQYITVRSGIDLKRFSPKPLPNNKVVTFLFAGRLAEQKGLINLILAANKLKKENIKFLIAGDGELREDLKKKIQYFNLKNVEMLGEVKDILPLLEKSDVVIVPSLFEGTPRIIYEAMAVGRAVIASDLPGVRVQVINGKTGILVKPGDVDELAEKILLLAKNKELRERMGREATKFSKDFGKENLVKGVEKVYEEMLKKKRIKTN